MAPARRLRGAAFPPRPARSRLHQGSPDLALAIRPRYADHRHLGHAAPPAEPDGPASYFAGLEAGSLRARLHGRAWKLVIQAGEGCPRLLGYCLPGQDIGLAGQADDPLDLVAGGGFRHR